MAGVNKLNSYRFYDKTIKSLNFLIDGTIVSVKEADLCMGVDRKLVCGTPDYRTVKKGLNIYGKWVNSKCRAYSKEIIVPKGNTTIDLAKEEFVNCPLCKTIVNPITVGFWSCKYKIYGTKIDGDRLVPFGPDFGEAKEQNTLKKYDSELNGTATFVKLVFEVTEIL